MKPSVGGIVHYVSYGTPGGEYAKQCRAAVVTAVMDHAVGVGEADGWTVGLAVLNPEGMFFNQARYDEWDGANALEGAMPQGGSWHWPERVED